MLKAVNAKRVANIDLSFVRRMREQLQSGQLKEDWRTTTRPFGLTDQQKTDLRVFCLARSHLSHSWRNFSYCPGSTQVGFLEPRWIGVLRKDKLLLRYLSRLEARQLEPQNKKSIKGIVSRECACLNTNKTPMLTSQFWKASLLSWKRWMADKGAITVFTLAARIQLIWKLLRPSNLGSWNLPETSKVVMENFFTAIIKIVWSYVDHCKVGFRMICMMSYLVVGNLGVVMKCNLATSR